MSDYPQPGDPPPDDPRPDFPATSQFPPVGYTPPVNYAPPGQAPDYGHQYPPGGYPAPPPGYPGYPPPPPRRSNIPLIAVIVAVALLLCGGLATTGILIARNVSDRAHEAVRPLTDPTLPALPTDIPNLPGLPTDDGGLGGQQIKVTYQVTGAGPAEILYVEKLGASPTRVDDVKLPWSLTMTMRTPALVSIIAMRSGTSEGQVTCRALVDGKEVKKATSGNSAFATAACTYVALD